MDGPLRTSLLGLGLLVCGVGVCTFSFKKMMLTYVFGMLGIAGLLLPDWEYFDRDFSEWVKPMPAPRPGGADQAPVGRRFKFYPMRVAMLTTVYCFGLYKWWKFITG